MPFNALEIRDLGNRGEHEVALKGAGVVPWWSQTYYLTLGAKTRLIYMFQANTDCFRSPP